MYNPVDLTVSIILFALTLTFVILKPKGIDIGYSALLGALIAFILGLVSLQNIIEVGDIVWNPTLTFVAIIIFSLIFDEAGVFKYLAAKIIIMSKGSGKKIFLYFVILATFISTVFANDGTAIELTPIVVALLYRLNVNKNGIMAYVMIIGFLADAASLPLLISNLVNIIAATYFGIQFFQYMVVMIVPDIVSVVVGSSILYFIYRKEININYSVSIENPEEDIVDRNLFRIFFPFIITIIIVYSIGGFFSIPISLIALPASIILIFVAIKNGKIDWKIPIKDAPWQIVLFSLGMYIVVFSMANNGLISILNPLIINIYKLPDGLNFIGLGSFFALLSSIMNNLPSVLLGDLLLKSTGISGYPVLINAIGNDIGPKFSPIGSLATLVWIYMLKKKSNISINTYEYVKIGLTAGIPSLILSLISYWAILNIF
ncbi:ArsB/NhaD family transporter [Caldiplasma sukawensis]